MNGERRDRLAPLGELAFGDLGGEDRESLADAPEIAHDLRDQPLGQPPAGPRQQRLDQKLDQNPEALGRGKV